MMHLLRRWLGTDPNPPVLGCGQQMPDVVNIPDRDKPQNCLPSCPLPPPQAGWEEQQS
jgi:hypothetical protein